ncbi:BrnA antitoxin family protein [uncultured Gammaproteobacteria bacterium]
MVNIRELTAAERSALNAVASKSDGEIDTSDAPEVTDWSGAVRGGLYRPVKRLTSLRLDTDLVEWFKARGDGYQTRINAALREYVEQHRHDHT